MTLQVFTARINRRDPDRFDITRKSGGPEGHVFAPSWEILKPALEARRIAEELKKDARRLKNQPSAVQDGDYRAFELQAERIEEDAWIAYEPAFLDEMRQSYRAHRAAWELLLRRQRVVLVCYCPTRKRCHRGLHAERILPAFGAVDCGELAA